MANNDQSMSTSEAGSLSSGKFEEGSKRASEAGKKGAAMQPRAAKVAGGKRGGSASSRS